LYIKQADNNKDGRLPAIERLLEKLITNLMDKREEEKGKTIEKKAIEKGFTNLQEGTKCTYDILNDLLCPQVL
jgi:hypothetical protein